MSAIHYCMNPRLLTLCLFWLVACAKYPTTRSTPYGFYRDPDVKFRPFQVLTAENARKIGDSTYIERYDLLGKYDLISITNGGNLVLLHFTGRFLEIDQDTLLDMYSVSKHLEDRLNISGEVHQRPIMENLFRDIRLRQSRIHSVTYHHCLSYDRIEFLHSLDLMGVSANDPAICLRWIDRETDQDTSSYVVKIKNIFDEPVDSIFTDQPEIALDLSGYENEEGLFILRVIDGRNEEITSMDIGLLLGSEEVYWPRVCNISSSLSALELGFFLENNGQLELAGKYYQLAEDLSQESIYHEINSIYLGEK